MKILIKLRAFFTNTVVYLIVIGAILIIIGHFKLAEGLFYWNLFDSTSHIHDMITTFGSTLLGSGVFTAVIKSLEYSDVFSKIVQDIIFSKKYLEKRSDKKDLWKMLTRMLYEEKFPAISEEIEEIIETQYLPINANFYIENYDFCINVIEVNDDFTTHNELTKMVIKPISRKEKVKYIQNTSLDVPDASFHGNDITSIQIDSISVNGEEHSHENIPFTLDPKYKKESICINLSNEDEYLVIIKRTKTFFKKTNADKKLFTKSITNNLSVTLICPNSMNVTFCRMGTTQDFIITNEQINSDIRFQTWNYNGLVLPHQGFMLVFK